MTIETMNPSTSRRRSSTPPSPTNGTFAQNDDLSSSTSKRPTLSSHNSYAIDHYDIYCIPSTTPSLPLPQATYFPSASFLIVNKNSGLQSGLGVRFGLMTRVDQRTCDLVADPGFSLFRDASYRGDKAVLLGWVQQEALSDLENLIRKVEMPNLLRPTGREMLDWILAVARTLEYEGIAANGELLLSDVLDERKVS